MTTPAKARKALQYSVTVTLISFLSMCGFVVGFVQIQIDSNNRRSCELIRASLVPRPTPPDPNLSTASTEYGIALREYNELVQQRGDRIAQTFKDLATQYDCIEGGKNESR